MQASIHSLLEKGHLTKLPSLPGVLAELLNSIDSDTVSFHHLSELVNKDPVLTAKMLSVGNSALFMRPQKFTSVERVMITLGLHLVKTIIIAAAVQQFFEKLSHGMRIDLRTFWRQTLTAATSARVLAQLTGYPAPGEAYLAGLMCNLGQLVLVRGHPDSYAAILELGDDAAVCTVEAGQYGATHAEVGAAVVESWNLHSYLAEAVRYHHEPADQVTDAPHLVKILNLASGLGAASVEGREPPYRDADLLFGLTREVTNSVQRQAKEQTAEVAAALHLETATPQAANETVEQGPMAKATREQALLGAVQQQLKHADDLEALGEAIFHCTNVLFGLEPVIYLHDRELDQLTPLRLSGQDWRIAELALPCATSNSMVAHAFRSGELLSELADSAAAWPVVDRQLCELLGGEGLHCVPLRGAGDSLGVLVIGTNPARQPMLNEIRPLFQLFASEAADALQRFHRRTADRGGDAEEMQQQWRARIRELVHETNNPLGIVRNYLYLLGSQLDSDPQAQENLRVVQDEIERVAGLIRRFTEIETEEEVKPRAVDINQLLSDVMRLIEPLIVGRNIEVKTDFDAALPPVMTRYDLLKQVMLNLVKNACEAMTNGGRLELSTQDYVYWHDRECIEIVVSDSGPGIPPHVLANLFKPVTSTKGEGHGGLGLSIAKNLMDELEGFIGCRSSEAKGTRFQLLLPRELADGRDEERKK
ncbi:MAG: HDOD domain-containing protein [Proteobacteria bacterium]|nr:MAG: HDOD domain-containing protein [Pseudomonadota bacterium]QKK10314.1 MAG: HDOD domain-containing protein [Pseudomonadota bacterium]